MKPLTCEEIRQAVHGRWLRKGQTQSIAGVTIDSRQVHAGDLFVAIKGERFDGHEYVASAAADGCTAAIVRMDTPLDSIDSASLPGGLIGVGDTIEALGQLGAYYRTQVAARVVAVTGSNGKTTTKRMIDHILATRLAGSGSPKSFNNNIGVPLTLLAVRPKDDYVICEVGSNAPGEIAALAAICRPDIAVITSVGPTHLEKLGTVEKVAVEKASLLGPMDADSVAIVNHEAPFLERAIRNYAPKIIRFGAGDDCDLRLSGYHPQPNGCRFEVNGRLWVSLPMPGRHNASNALAAMAVAQRFNFTPQEAAEALAGFGGAEMRLEIIEAGPVTVINDTYNANPGSVAAAVDVLAERPAQRRVIVLGDMRELGDQSQPLHEEMGELVARLKIDLLIGVGGLGRYIALGATRAGAAAEAFDSVEAAAAALPSLLRAGDVVLVKGSRTMAMERLIAPIRAAFGGGST